MNMLSRTLSQCNKSLVSYRKASKKVKKTKPYNVVNYEQNNNGLIVYIQIYPTGTILKFSPRNLINDDKMLDGFSSSDIRTIAFFAYRELDNNKVYAYSIRSIKLIDEIYYIEYICLSGDISTIAIDDLSKNKDLLNGFSPVEAHMVGYVSCEGSFLKEAVLKKYACEI